MGRILTHSDYRMVPWKNGRGQTSEMFRLDLGGRMIFRVSSAMVQEDGPFSDYTGYDRTLINLGPGSMRLRQQQQGNSERVSDLPPFALIHFDGSLATHCQVTEPCQDLNIFCATDAVFASTLVRQLPKPEFVPIPPTSGLMIFVAEGSFVAKDLSGREYFVERGECLVREPSDSVNQERWMLASASQTPCRYVAVAFFPGKGR
jgi:environmental stress-induced protein Ves